MTPLDFERWERLCSLRGAAEAAMAFGVGADTYSHWRTGRTTPPRALWYAMGWTLLYGLAHPFPPAEIPEREKVVRKQLNLTQDEMAVLLGYQRAKLYRLEHRIKGSPVARGLLSYALAWLLLYGSRNPFPNALAHGARCPTCGR